MTVTRSPWANPLEGGALDDFGQHLVPDDSAARHAMIEVPLIDVQIGAADADPPDPEQRLPLPRGRGWGLARLEGAVAAVERGSHRCRLTASG